MTVEIIENLHDVRPGDICLTRMGGFIPGFFPVRIGTALCRETYAIGPFSADHALVCVEAGRPNPPYPDGFGNYAPRAVQAMPHGAEEIALTPAKHWGPTVRWFRMSEDWPGQAADAAAIARLFVTEKIPYSPLSYVALGAWSRGWRTPELEAWIDRRGPAVELPRWSNGPVQDGEQPGRRGGRLPQEAICSVLVDQAWSLAGKRVLVGAAHQAVTPGALGIRLADIAVARSR